MNIHYVVQEPGSPYTELFRRALSQGEFTERKKGVRSR